MSVGSWIVLALLVLYVAYVLRGAVRKIKAGQDPMCDGCDCGCSKGESTCSSCSASAVMLNNIREHMEAREKETEGGKAHEACKAHEAHESHEACEAREAPSFKA